MLILGCRWCNHLWTSEEVSEVCPACGNTMVEDGQKLINGMRAAYDELKSYSDDVSNRMIEYQMELTSKSRNRI